MTFSNFKISTTVFRKHLKWSFSLDNIRNWSLINCTKISASQLTFFRKKIFVLRSANTLLKKQYKILSITVVGNAAILLQRDTLEKIPVISRVGGMVRHAIFRNFLLTWRFPTSNWNQPINLWVVIIGLCCTTR